MLTFLFFNFFTYSNPHCEIRCLEQANTKLVSSCVEAYKRYVDRHFYTPEQAIQRIQSSSVMKSRCTIDDDSTKIYANKQRLEQEANRCIINYCKSTNDHTSKISTADEMNFDVEINLEQESASQNNPNPVSSKSKVLSQPTRKIKFQPLNCMNDPNCISRDLNRCSEHNQQSNAEPFDCRSHYSSLQVFNPIKNTISFLSNEGGVSGLNQKISQAMQSCESSHSNAELCCGDSLSCGMGGEPSNKGQHLKTITNLTQIINSAGGLPEKCNALKNISRAGTAGVMAFSSNCYKAVDTCHNSCEPYKNIVQEIEDKKRQAECKLKNEFSSTELNYLFGSTSSYYKDFCSDELRLDTHKDSYRGMFAQCTGFKSEATKANADVGGLQTITEWTQKCEEYSKNNNPITQAQQAFNGDCTNPAHFSNPICVQCRLDPSAQQCVGINTGANPTQANSNKPGIIEDTDRNDDLMGYNSLGTSSATDENPGLNTPQPIGPDGNRGLAGSGMGGGSGGGLGQDNIQALGTDPGAQGKAGGEGYNTNVLGNATGGGGYSASSMGYGSGGGYSNRITTDIYENTPPTGIIKDGFDLREYLPGGKAFKHKSRLPAGYIQLPDGEVIGPKHGNIFHMMHERYAYYESLGKFWPPHYSKEKIECIKKSGILNHPPYSNQWSGDNLHKPTPQPDPPQCRHFADHDPSKPDPTMIYLKAEAKKERLKRSPQSVVASYKGKTLHEIYSALTTKRSELSKPQYEALRQYYMQQRNEYRKKYGK